MSVFVCMIDAIISLVVYTAATTKSVNLATKLVTTYVNSLSQLSPRLN